MGRILATFFLAGLLAPAAARAEPELLQADIDAIEQMSALGDDAVDLGVEDCLQRALRSNLGLQVRVRSLEATRSRLQAAWGPWMPRITAGWGYNPSRSETFREDFETWQSSNSDSSNYNVGADFNLFTGTSFGLNWSQGTFGTEVSFDPEVYVDNPFDADDPLPILVDRDFKTRWAALSLELSQNLLEGIAPGYQLRGVRKSRLAVDSEELAQHQAVQQVVADVLKAYWDLVAARRAVEIERIDRRLAEEQRTVTEARIAAGDLAPIELFRIEETVASSSAQLLEAGRAADEAEQRLKLLLGLGRGDELYSSALRPVDGIGTQLPAHDREGSLSAALEHNPQLIQQRIELASKRIDLQASRHEVLPRLDLGASLALSGSAFDADEAVQEVFAAELPDFRIGMNFAMPVPDLGAIHSLRATVLELEAAELAFQQAEREVEAGVETALRSITSYEAQVEVAEVRVTFAAQTAEAAEATYSAGRNTLRDVLEAQAALKDARQALVQAQVNELKARLDLELLRGSLADTLELQLQ